MRRLRDTNLRAMPLSETQRQGRTFFLCALLLLAAMLFIPLVQSFASGTQGLFGSISTGVIYLLVFAAAFRGGGLSLGIIKVCLGALGAVLAIAVILVGMGILAGKCSPPGRGWPTVKDAASLLQLLFVYWAIFLSKSVREFLVRQRVIRHADAMRRIREE